jgi:hypothetical protein
LNKILENHLQNLIKNIDLIKNEYLSKKNRSLNFRTTQIYRLKNYKFYNIKEKEEENFYQYICLLRIKSNEEINSLEHSFDIEELQLFTKDKNDIDKFIKNLNLNITNKNLKNFFIEEENISDFFDFIFYSDINSNEENANNSYKNMILKNFLNNKK